MKTFLKALFAAILLCASAFGQAPINISTARFPGGGTITGAGGAVTVTASGTNQPITLTPSGTGSVVLSGTGASPGLLQLPTHTTIAGGVGMGAATSFYTTNVGRLRLDAMTGTDCAMKFALNGSDTLQFAISGGDTYLDYQGTMHFRAGFGGTEKMSLTSAGALTLAGTVTSYNGIATAGNGVASIQGAGRVTAQNAANAAVATYTVGASDASFLVSANVNVTTSSAEAFTVTCTYTDETNTSRIMTFNFQILVGTIGTAINFANGAVPYEGVPNHIRCKASTAITIKTAAGGTYTGCVYNAEGVITKLQ